VSLTAPKLIILESVDSTNNYAMAMVQKGVATTEDAVFAMEQSSGKGRRGKTWKSQKGKNILLTVLAQMQWLPVQKQFQLSVAVALACFDFFSKYTKENIKIKWPNDIFINDRKAGGILIENVIQGNLWQWAVIGIGLNINQGFEKDTLKAISLRQITGKEYQVMQLAGELHEIVLKKLHGLQSGEHPKMLAAYNENLFCRNKMVKLKKGNIVFEAEIEGVSASGELITKNIMERRFGFDEVQWIDV
jgi:BirA family transcriptional regulator, biotin operon repressor / biotin---[acetyl-CoA-carboxylase] ligase